MLIRLIDRRLAFAAAFLLVITFGRSAHAEWEDLGSKTPSAPTLEIARDVSGVIEFEVTFSGYSAELVRIGNRDCVSIRIPGCGALRREAAPSLPTFSRLFHISDTGRPRVEVELLEVIERPLRLPVIPSKGNVSRSVPWESVPYLFGSTYQLDEWYPKRVAFTGRPFLVRDRRGVRFQLNPIRVNPVRGVVQIVRRARVRITHGGRGRVNLRAGGGGVDQTESAEFREIYASIFANGSGGRPGRPSESGALCIITAPEFIEGARALEKHRRSERTVSLVKTDGTATVGEVQKLVDAGYRDGCSFFVLIGDFEHIPAPTGDFEGAVSDPSYVMLEGADYFPDAFISRLSAKSNADVITQVEKIKAYDGASGDEAWLRRGALIASDDGSPTHDWKRAEYLRLGQGDKLSRIPIEPGGLEGAGYDFSGRMFYRFPTASSIGSAIDKGVGFINYIGHGYDTGWVTSGFDNSDISRLRNYGMYPVIFSVACVNGAFHRPGDDCFAESWLKTPSAGAVAIFASTTNMAWVPPCDAQIASCNAVIRRQFRTVGATLFIGSVRCLQLWGDEKEEDGTQFVEQTHMFGDCSMRFK